MACPSGNCGPGYASPKEAFAKGAREKLLYIPCLIPGKDRPDYLSTVDVDPQSPSYGKVLFQIFFHLLCESGAKNETDMTIEGFNFVVHLCFWILDFIIILIIYIDYINQTFTYEYFFLEFSNEKLCY